VKPYAHRRAGRSFKPALDRLEDRSCPAGDPTITVSGTALTVVGNELANRVVLRNGAAGAVAVSVDGVSVTTSRIASVTVQAGAGDDTVFFAQDAPLTRPQAVLLDLGEGSDRADLGYNRIVTAPLNVDVLGRGGNDLVTGRFKDVARSGSVTLRAWLAGGSDTFNYFVSGTLAGRTTLKADGGDGNDFLGVNAGGFTDNNAQAVANVLPGGTLDSEVIGGTGDDIAVSRYLGKSDGVLKLYGYGNDGADTLRADLNVHGASFGAVTGYQRGDAGNDLLAFQLLTNGAPLSALAAGAYGMEGMDSGLLTGNVYRWGIERMM
jgi:hypothetical protein